MNNGIVTLKMVMNHAKDVDHKRGDGLIRLDILGEKLDEMDLEITQYVNDNVKEIIRLVIDYLEDNNDFTIWDVIPKNTNNIVFYIIETLWEHVNIFIKNFKCCKKIVFSFSPTLFFLSWISIEMFGRSVDMEVGLEIIKKV